MTELILISSLTLTAFISTNVDNLILLAILSGHTRQQRSNVMWGYAAAMTIVAIIGLIVAQAADALPTQWTGYVGIVPLLMGIYRFIRILRPPVSASNEAAISTVGTGAAALLMLSNSSDTLGVVLPLFAETPEPLSYVIVATLVSASFAWFGLATLVVRHPLAEEMLKRLERWLVPFLLIGIGIYILLDTTTDTLA